MQGPREREWLVTEGIQGMNTMAVLVLLPGTQVSETKWAFTGYRFYPGAIDTANGYLYSSKEEALEDDEPVTILKCWREESPVNELVDDLIVALSKFQTTL